MRLRSLSLRQFRNYEVADVQFDDGINLVFGRNAQGKSNLLEGAALTLTGRSHRTRRDEELLRFGADAARIRVEVAGPAGNTEMDVALLAETGGPAWRVRINGVPARRSELMGRVVCVVAAPEDLAIMTGPPALRRRLLDGALAQLSPSYYHLWLRYGRVVAQRNHLLRAARAGLEPWDAQLIDLGARLTVRRHAYVSRLAERAGDWFVRFAGCREQLGLRYVPSWKGLEEVDVARSAEEALRANARLDRLRGLTGTGPHRDDLELLVNERALRAFGSRGQQRAVALAVRLAEYEVAQEELGDAPILFLDDVLAELDPERRERVLSTLSGEQVVLTMTAPAAKEWGLRAKLFLVEAGQVQAARCLPLFETS